MDADRDDSCDSENLEVTNNNSANTSNTSNSATAEDDSVCKEIFEALRKGNVRYLEAYLRENVGPTFISDVKGQTMLHHAVRHHQRACVLKLMQEVPDLLIVKNNKNETPLDLAVKHKCVIEIIEILVDKISKYELDLHIMFIAIKKMFNKSEEMKNYYLELILCFLNNGANVDLGEENQWTLILEAVVVKNLQLVKLLVQYGANPFIEDSHGANAFSHAARRGNLPILEYLLEHHPRGLESTDKKGNSLLFLASSVDNGIDCVKYLLALGAKPCEPNKLKETPLLAASINISGAKIVKVLLEAGADPREFNTARDSPLMRAVMAGNFEVVALLLEAGADPHIRDPKNNTPLMIAAQLGHGKIVRALLLHDAKSLHSALSKTALDLACEGEHLQVIGALLQHKKCLNVDSRFKPTAGVVYNALNKQYSTKVLEVILNSQLSPSDEFYYDTLQGLNIFEIVKLNPLSTFFNISNSLNTLLKEEEMVEVFLKHRNYINPLDGSIPPLTVLVSQFTEDETLSMTSPEIKMLQRLITMGARVNVKSKSMNITTPDANYKHIECIRELLELPDALWLAYHKKCRVAVKILMSYWATPPLSLLVLDRECNPQDFSWWYRNLSAMGLPHGTYIYHCLVDHFNKFADEIEEHVWMKFEADCKMPMTLTRAARFAVRKTCAEQFPSENLPDVINRLHIPETLKQFLHLHDP